MSTGSTIRSRVTLLISSTPEKIYTAFIEPDQLTQFWLSKASGPLRIGQPVRWDFMVAGAKVDTTATVMVAGRRLAWNWDDSSVTIEFEPVGNETAVTIVNDRFSQQGTALVDIALDATEGFAFVLADLKTFMESGTSAGITKAKAKLIELRQ